MTEEGGETRLPRGRGKASIYFKKKNVPGRTGKGEPQSVPPQRGKNRRGGRGEKKSSKRTAYLKGSFYAQKERGIYKRSKRDEINEVGTAWGKERNKEPVNISRGKARIPQVG